ncbi:MAG: HindIII family type II restriction endonuclease [Synergistaceae bacterium]|nr:HindIII family type II restriction endonuclease [Synergistaceae bacterium]
MFNEILAIINNSADKNFEEVCQSLNECVLSDKSFIDTLREIGTIPECIAHDSTEEKLFSKASDSVLARAFIELGLKSSVFQERGDSADVLAESKIFGYTFVADAKAFRLSRTAKNQKDFKISALSAWRKDNDYAVLCSPYFHYPVKNSQIYSQALENNVCLISWEHLIFMIEHKIKESKKINLSEIWNFSNNLSHKVLVSDMKKNFLPEFDIFLTDLLKIEQENFDQSILKQISVIKKRSDVEKNFWLKKIDIIKKYSREQAISELIKTQKIYEKINQINTYVNNIL